MKRQVSPLKLSLNIARYMLAVGAILSVQDGDTVKPGAALARIAKGGATQRDITGGLPRVAELFEARRPKDDAVIADIDGKIEFTRDYKNKRKIQILPEDEAADPSAYLIAKGKHMLVQDGDMVKKGDYIIDGNPAPHDILSIMGVEALAEYLVDEVQGVYRLQGVPINDKHIEVIVRQMLQKVEVTDPGDTTLLRKEQMDKVEFNKVNDALLARDKKASPAVATPVLLGITKASLQTRSFISAASFQETTRVLTEASVQGKEDMLEGQNSLILATRNSSRSAPQTRLASKNSQARLKATPRNNVATEIDTVYRFQRSSFIAGDEGYDLKIKSRALERGFFIG